MGKKLTKEEVSERSLKFGFELIGDYINSGTKTEFRCLKHNEIHLSYWEIIQSGSGLKCCKKHSLSNKKTPNLEAIKNKCLNIGTGFEFLENEWKGSWGTKYMVKCLKHNESHVVFWSSLTQNKSIHCCWLEKVTFNNKSRSMENSPLWKPQSFKVHARKQNWFYSRDWSKKAKKRDGYICDICNIKFDSKDLQAHHLNSYKTDKISRLDINEGITLCRIHHQNFHIKYGRGTNTKEQFEEFKIISKAIKEK